MNLTHRKAYESLSCWYPNARVYVLDELYEVPSEGQVQGYFKKFRRSLWKYNLTKWLRDVRDCDDFAWQFKGYCGIQRMLEQEDTPFSIGFICYNVDGDGEAHAINNAIMRNGAGSIVRELEPQGDGLKSLNQHERDSAWLVIV